MILLLSPLENVGDSTQCARACAASQPRFLHQGYPLRMTLHARRFGFVVGCCVCSHCYKPTEATNATSDGHRWGWPVQELRAHLERLSSVSAQLLLSGVNVGAMQSKSIVLIISAALACCFGVVAAHGAQEFGDGGDAAFEAAARLRGAHAEPPMRAATPQYSENQPAGATFKQDRLAIGFWVDPPADGAPGEVDRLYAQVADANFTFVLGGFGDTTPESAAAQIAACKAHDLRVVVHASDASSTASLPWEDGTSWGYQLKDEPLPPAFPGLAALAENVTRLRPGALPFINLLPDYGPFPNKTAYLQYVEEFVATVPTPVLSFDSYPLYQRSFDQATGTVQVQDTRADYLFNLRAFRTAAEKHGLVFWNFFNTMPYGSHAVCGARHTQVRWNVAVTDVLAHLYRIPART